jgi:hypothetical protein
VADDDAGPVLGVVADHPRQPVALIFVEVFGRFVEQQDLGPAQQAAGQRDEALLSTRWNLNVDDGVVSTRHPGGFDDDRMD